ncbi:MAG TPA: hypothetical protein DIC53_03055 [Synergistaceae bacterium]|nr:hypothetical protein [Synergistaceae bacterium]
MIVHPVTLGEEVESAEILPLSDFHIGDPGFNERALKDYLAYILGGENRFILLNGDILNNATKASVSDIYAETMQPRRQIEHAADLLAPVADRILGIVSGNHERRTDKESGISPVEILAEKLNVPYFGIEALLKIRLGKNIHWRQTYYTLYATHGWGGGRLRGGKVNNLERLKNIVLCDVYVMAHTHGQVSFPSVIYVPETKNDAVTERVMWFINSGSFLDRGEGYAAAKGYEPQVLGCPIIELSGKGRKITVIQGRV